MNLSVDYADTMPRFAEVARRKRTHSKKSEKDDSKRKTPPAEDDAFVPEPAAPKSKSLTIKEPTAQAPSQPPPVEGKGKGKVVEPPRPLKTLRHTREPSLPASSPDASEAVTKRIAKPQLHAALHPAAGDTGFTMFNDYAKWLGQCASSVAPETWEHILIDQPNSLLSFELMSSFIVSTFQCLTCFLAFPYHFLDTDPSPFFVLSPPCAC